MQIENINRIYSGFELKSCSLPVKLGLVLLGSWVIAAGAYIEVPMWPVPMTMQSLAVLLVGGAYGMRMASGTVALYLAQGAIGLPMFAGGMDGVTHLLGPTGGYLFGFMVAASLMGWLSDKWLAGKSGLFFNLVIGSSVVFVAGVFWL